MAEVDQHNPAKRGRRGRGRGRGIRAGTKKRGVGRSSQRCDAEDDDLDLELAFSSQQGFNLDLKLTSEKFEEFFLIDLIGKDFTVAYIQKHGFKSPIRIRDKSGLGMKVPKPDFTIGDVRQYVGARRMVDVMDVSTQRNLEMTMKEWEQYYENPSKDRLLNVISLEFSHTKLDSYVHAPLTVRQIDWVEISWPRSLKLMQKESTNTMDDMWYPKVQKYCLMSVAGCYTDFHIDFGGTSVWYHILRGSKIFWLIPPTERNLQLYEQWTLSGKQSDIFFGDLVEKCARVNLEAGNTFLIPSGWIHAVYTPSDSLVFGGNFLHSYAIETQLRVAQLEDVTRVPAKFRFPFYTEMLWYVLERYVHTLLGRSHLDLSQLSQVETPATSVSPGKHVHLTSAELHGLRAIVLYLHSLPPTRKNVPDLLANPVALIHDVRTLVEQHRSDQAHLAITGIPVIGITNFVKAKKPDVPVAAVKLEQSDQSQQPSLSSEVKLEQNQVMIKEEPEAELTDESDNMKSNVMMKSTPFPHLQTQLKRQQQEKEELSKKLRAPVCVVRPATVGSSDPRELQKASGQLLSNLEDVEASELILRREILIPVFQRLPMKDLLVCMRVCRSWNRWTIDPSLWPSLNLSHRQLSPSILAGIVRRQCQSLTLDWSSLNSQQLVWLIDRLPRLSVLSLQGCSVGVLAAWKSAPISSASRVLAKLTVLDLSWVSALSDAMLERTLLQLPPNASRLVNLKQLALAGSEITDRSLSTVAANFPHLELLCLAFCKQISIDGLEPLLNSTSLIHLQHLDLTGCVQLTDGRISLERASSSRSSLKLQLDFDVEFSPVHRCLRLK